MSNYIELVKKYCPYIFFDKMEPFFPIKVGYTVFEQDGLSHSFEREIKFYDESIKYVIEYAIYWDFDIEHLYELEHLWIYVNDKGQVCECEGSFHGYYIRNLLKDKSNLVEDTHVIVYSQPGKHAFMPQIENFDLLPDAFLYGATWECAGSGGLLVAKIFEGLINTNEKTDKMVEKYLKMFKFIPSMEFQRYIIDDNKFIPWEQLYEQIPRFVAEKLQDIQNWERVSE